MQWYRVELTLELASLTPAATTDPAIAKQLATTNLYFASINYIFESKKGNFFEHSPILYDISGVATWTKVNSGLLKMYMNEVLLKFPVVQHVQFCNLFRWKKYDGNT